MRVALLIVGGILSSAWLVCLLTAIAAIFVEVNINSKEGLAFFIFFGWIPGFILFMIERELDESNT